MGRKHPGKEEISEIDVDAYGEMIAGGGAFSADSSDDQEHEPDRANTDDLEDEALKEKRAIEARRNNSAEDVATANNDDLELLKIVEKRSIEASNSSLESATSLMTNNDDPDPTESDLLLKIVEKRASQARESLLTLTTSQARESLTLTTSQARESRTLTTATSLRQQLPSPGAYAHTPLRETVPATDDGVRLSTVDIMTVQRPTTTATPDDEPVPVAVDNTTATANNSNHHPDVVPQQQLPSARPIVDDDLETATPHHVAEEVDLEQQAQMRALRKETMMRTNFWAFLFVLSLLGNVVLLVLFLKNKGDDGGNNPTTAGSSYPDATTSSPSAISFASQEDYFWSLLPSYTKDTIEKDSDTPQARAFQWLTEDPNFDYYIIERLLDRFALAVFYFSTNGDRWDHNDNWLSYQAHECNWTSTEPYNFGEYDYDDDIINITGSRCKRCVEEDDDNSKSEEEWCRRDICLFDNNLDGSIPRELSLMTSLHGLLVDVNNLERTIPTELGLMTELKILSLGRNNLVGAVPTEIGSIQTLMEFGLDDMALHGTLHTEFGRLTKLRYTYFGENQFTGTIPSEFGELTLLIELGMGINHLTGAIPSELGVLHNTLEILWLYETQVSGFIPSQLGRLTQLIDFYLVDNMLTGFLSTELGNLVGATEYNLGSNQLSGTIPTEIGTLAETMWFSLHENDLTGTVPTELGLLRISAEINLAGNQLTGTMPWEVISSLITEGNLTKCNITDNEISGIVPEDLCLLNHAFISFDCNEVLCGCDCNCTF